MALRHLADEIARFEDLGVMVLLVVDGVFDSVILLCHVSDIGMELCGGAIGQELRVKGRGEDEPPHEWIILLIGGKSMYDNGIDYKG